MKRRLISLFLESDTTATRFSLMLYALIMSVSFLIDGNSCDLRLCGLLDVLLQWIGGWKAWSIAWMVYAVLAAWRILDSTHRTKAAHVVNFFGALLFSVTAAAAIIARWPVMLISAPYIVLAAAAIWVAARTAINQGVGFRGD